jgi:hypothetical protein
MMRDTNRFLSLVTALDFMVHEPDGPAVGVVLDHFSWLVDRKHLRHAVHMCTNSAVYKPQSDDAVRLLAAILRDDDTAAAEHLGGVLNAWRGDLVTRWDRLEALCPAE